MLLLRGENPSRVLEGVHAKVAELNERLKADDVQIVSYLDRSTLVDATIDKVGAHGVLGHRPRAHRAHPLPRQPAQRADRRHHHSVRDGGGVHPDVPHQNFGQPAVARRDRLRHHRRRRDRDDGSDPAPPRGKAERAAHRSRRPRRRAPGGAADLFRHRDHHHDLSAAVRVPADRGEAVLSDGLCGRLRAVRRAAVRADGDSGPRLPGVSQAAAGLPQSGAGVARGGLSARLARLAAAAGHRLHAGRRRRHCGGHPRRDGVARIPAGARRRLDLAARRAAAGHFAAEGDRDGRRSARGP